METPQKGGGVARINHPQALSSGLLRHPRGSRTFLLPPTLAELLRMTRLANA
jgi:hypothetical protein